MGINWDSQSLLVLGMSGLVFILVGAIMYIFPPKKINHFYGYRTPRSMASQERWDFSQKYSSVLLIISGVVLVPLGVIISLLSISHKTDVLLSIPLLLLSVLLFFIKTERELKKRFGKN
ncbi:SdpI family protein [Flavobacterium rakeshii]|uniref:SdpI family protein n=1 Tax=Flavobacterium rakeshii TaxID=1038845 RepID=UPI002E7B16E9|nr:SdpI family protein [Flavobacterium rakeshii]MEE1898128.1 SdpI family protein [Flavobacterium rakeshii]